MPDSNNGNGFTNKEMLQMVLKNQEEMASKLEGMQKEINGKIGKMEFMGYILMVSALLMIANNWVSLF